MAEKKYIDEQGLATLWEKIKNSFVKPSDLPKEGSGTLIIKKNGTSVGTFKANETTDKEIDILVPDGDASNKGVDTSIASGSTSTNLPTSKAVADHVKEQVIDKIGTAIAPLGNDGLVPAVYLPSYVDDTIEGYYSNGGFYENTSHTVAINGESGKIYVDLYSNKTYRWSGTTWVEISKSLAIGTTAGTAYDGASGAKNASDISALQTSVSNAITTAGKGLSKDGNTLSHSNSITAQATSKFVAIKVDAQGHISAIGDSLEALTTAEINEILK